jgi:hypothetical protein
LPLWHLHFYFYYFSQELLDRPVNFFVVFGLRNDLLNSFVILGWDFVLRLFVFEIWGCDRVEWGVGNGMSERRKLVFERKEDDKERNLFYECERRGFICDVDGFRLFLGLCECSRFGSKHSVRLIEIDERYERIDRGDFEDYE